MGVLLIIHFCCIVNNNQLNFEYLFQLILGVYFVNHCYFISFWSELLLLIGKFHYFFLNTDNISLWWPSRISFCGRKYRGSCLSGRITIDIGIWGTNKSTWFSATLNPFQLIFSTCFPAATIKSSMLRLEFVAILGCIHQSRLHLTKLDACLIYAGWRWC